MGPIPDNKVNDKVEAEVEDYEGLCDRLEALKRHLDLQQELSVLYSMQAIAHKLDVPSGTVTGPPMSILDRLDVPSAVVHHLQAFRIG